MNTYEEAKPRLPNQREKILNMLREAGEKGILNTEFNQIYVRWDARIRELYQEGYIIKAELLGNGIYNYTLISEPEVKHDKPKKAMDLLEEEIENQYGGEVNVEQLKLLMSKEGLNIVRRHGAHTMEVKSESNYS